MESQNALAAKGKIFLGQVQKGIENNKQEVKAGAMAVKEIKVDYDTYRRLTSSARIIEDPKKVGVIVTSMVMQKAMLAAGISTTDEGRACLEAVGSLAADFAMAAAVGPATLGFGAILPLAFAALDSYDVGSSCFGGDGPVTHAVIGNVKAVAKPALTATKHESWKYPSVKGRP